MIRIFYEGSITLAGNGPESVYAEIDLTRVAENTKILKNDAGTARLMAVVKANAYGHGAVRVARVALDNGASWLGVARLSEGVVLRKAGIQAPILILGYTSDAGVPHLLRYHLHQSILELNHAKSLSRAAEKEKGVISCHIKVDTGMGRVGFDATSGLPEESARSCAAAIAEAVSLKGLHADGIFTHFATADEYDLAPAQGQWHRFSSLLTRLEFLGITFEHRHAANSAGILTLPEARLDMVRGGISLYGLNPSPVVRMDLRGLRPVMALKGCIAQVKWVKKGQGVSYGVTWSAREDTLVATVPCGYGDGYPRGLSQRGRMLVKGESAPILGRICMDMTMIDVTGIQGVQVGDEVVIIGRQGDLTISVDEIAEMMGTINYEITCLIAPRVPRIYSF